MGALAKGHLSSALKMNCPFSCSPKFLIHGKHKIYFQFCRKQPFKTFSIKIDLTFCVYICLSWLEQTLKGQTQPVVKSTLRFQKTPSGRNMYCSFACTNINTILTSWLFSLPPDRCLSNSPHAIIDLKSLNQSIHWVIFPPTQPALPFLSIAFICQQFGLIWISNLIHTSSDLHYAHNTNTVCSAAIQDWCSK